MATNLLSGESKIAGVTKGGNKGYYLMTDKWFDEYNYEVVVDKKYLPKKILDLFKRKPVPLEPWDPMGALAR